MYAQIVLRQVAPAAEYFSQLNQVAGCDLYTRIQREAIALYALQLKTNPMVWRPAFRTENHRLAHQVFNHRLHPSVVEKVAYSKAAAHLRNLNGFSNQLAGVPERAVMLIDKQELWLQVSRGRMGAVYLRIYVAIDQEKILPTIVGEVDESVSPAHIA